MCCRKSYVKSTRFEAVAVNPYSLVSNPLVVWISPPPPPPSQSLLVGSGPGAEVSYRVYVDSGYVFAVMTALAPLCPLLGFCCLLYFIIIVPMMRWLIVFAYRPVFDGGGAKWPSLHHIIVSSLILGQVSFRIVRMLAFCRIYHKISFLSIASGLNLYSLIFLL